MPKTLTWLTPSDPAFPPGLVQHLGDKSPKRIATIGNLEILHSKAVALICSVKCPGNIIVQTYDLAQKLREAGMPVISGFHSPMERECLRILLRGNQPVILCPARSLQGMRLPQDYSPPLEQGRLLLLSPFSEKLRRGTIQTALYRNHLVAALADRIFVSYAAPSSKTEQFCRDLLRWKKLLFVLKDEVNTHLIALGAIPVTPDDAAEILRGL